MSGDSSDDSGAESDIGEKMAQIHERQLQQQQGQQHSDDDDEYDDSSDDDISSPRPVVQLLRNSRRNSKASNSVDVKLQKLDFQQAQRARMYRVQQQQQRQGCASSDDDDDAIQTVQNPRILAHDKKKAKYSLDIAMDVDDSDSDDDAGRGIAAGVLPTTQMGGTSVQDLQRRGISASNAHELQKLHAARVQLETISNKHSNNTSNPTTSAGAYYYSLTTATEEGGLSAAAASAAGPQYLVLRVHATVRHQKDATLVEQKQTTVTLSDAQNVQAVLDQVLQQWQYPAAQAVAVLKYQGQTLQHRFALAMYGMPTQGAIFELDLTLLDNHHHHGRPHKGGNSSSSNSQQPPMDVGPLIRVSLRCQKDTTVMKIGVREPFQRLVERYEQQQQKQNIKVQRLEFDGDTLPLTTTPAAHDMEDEDLVDVVLQT